MSMFCNFHCVVVVVCGSDFVVFYVVCVCVCVRESVHLCMSLCALTVMCMWCGVWLALRGNQCCACACVYAGVFVCVCVCVCVCLCWCVCVCVCVCVEYTHGLYCEECVLPLKLLPLTSVCTMPERCDLTLRMDFWMSISQSRPAVRRTHTHVHM